MFLLMYLLSIYLINIIKDQEKKLIVFKLLTLYLSICLLEVINMIKLNKLNQFKFINC